MAQAVDQAERERELTKQALASTLDRLEARVRFELDWKARLRRDGPRYAVIGAIVVAGVGGILLLRRAFAGEEAPDHVPGSIDEIAAELVTIRKRLDDAKINPDGGPVWLKVAFRGLEAAAAAGGTYAARRLMAGGPAPDADPGGRH